MGLDLSSLTDDLQTADKIRAVEQIIDEWKRSLYALKINRQIQVELSNTGMIERIEQEMAKCVRALQILFEIIEHIKSSSDADGMS